MFSLSGNQKTHECPPSHSSFMLIPSPPPTLPPHPPLYPAECRPPPLIHPNDLDWCICWHVVPQIMVVDETSMMSGEFLQQVEEKLRAVRGNSRAAGGLQLVFCGDFFQLPPVTTRWQTGTPPDAFLNWGYAFQAPAWNKCGMKHVLLTKVGGRRGRPLRG